MMECKNEESSSNSKHSRNFRNQNNNNNENENNNRNQQQYSKINPQSIKLSSALFSFQHPIPQTVFKK